MAKQLNSYQVNLAFTADTESAKRQLQDLQTRLSNLTAGKRIPGMELGITKDIQEGISAAAQLKVQLEQATNVKTGKLDLTKFSQSLKDSNMSIDKYANSLKNLGPQGQEAFLQLTRSISSAEVPLLHVNEKLNEMWVTLKNTARWQISSSILHGFMGAVQSAYGYAQDLNESLNNIRIVSGQSTEQMAKFADQANKAAKALSATTIDYTNAALIYYQQGLNEQEIEERAEVTLKMANVSRESAEVVSDQMTAVWNNFDDGSKSLEYYADVLTALGAKTASSTAEISDGLEKFAAVAETVGLSYEYATASLATITATTRQSADVVGTALKTVFARIQGLNLGETLDDGVTLNKYSDALNKVGISIFEQNGELKAMDDILEEMGSKWETLDKSQQTALAQTVAGVRQYTQLIALMDNWDFMQENLETAKNSEGALQEQANTYAESWEAASDRVQAAMEALYQDILDDEFFIDVLNGVEKVLTGVDDLIDGLGGIKPILTIISALFLKTFSGKVVSGVKSVKDGIVSIANPEKAKQKAIATRQESIDAGTKLINDISPDSQWGEVKRQGLTQEYAIQQSLLDNAGKITLEKQKEYQIRLDSLNLMQSELEVSAKKLDQDKASYAEQKRRQLLLAQQDTNDYSEDEARAYLLKNEQMGQIVAFENQIRAGKNAKDSAKAFDKIKERIQNAKTVDGDALNLDIDFDAEVQDLDALQAKLNSIFDQLFVDIEKFEHLPASIESVGKAAHDTAKEMVELNVQGENIGSVAEELQSDINGSTEALTDWRTGLVDIAGNVAMLAGSLTALGSAWGELETAIQEGDISGAAGSLVAMASVLPMVAGGISALLGTLQTVAPTMVVTNEATKALSLSLKGLSLSVPWLVVIATALTILLPKILELIPTAKKARESIQEATQAYEEQKQVLDDLNDTLQATKDRIEELNNQDTLTIVEQEELNKLKQELAYLERQKAIEEELAKAKQKEQVNSIKKNFSTAYSGLIGSAPIETRSHFGIIETPDEYYKRMLGEYELDSEIDAESYAALKQEVDEWKAENEQNRIQWLNENNELIKQAEQDYYAYIGAITSGVIERDEEALRSQQAIISNVRKNIYSSEGEYQQKHLNPILNTAAMAQNEDRIYSQINSELDIDDISISKRLQEELDLAGISTEEFLTYLQKSVGETKDKIDDLLSEDEINKLTADDWQILAELNFENIETADELWEALEKYKNSKINIAVEGLEGVQEFLDSINAKEKPFEEMLSTYKDKGYFTMDEIDEILTANPEYVKYLQETEKGWVLTGQALKDYLQLEGQESIAIKEKIALLKEQNGVNKDYVQNYTSTWEELANRAVDYQESMFGGSEDQVDLFTTRTEDLKAASEAYQAGTITAEEYFSKIDTRLKGIGSGFHDLSDEIDDNVEKTDLYEATLTTATGAIADGLVDLNKQFESGSINMDEYYEGTIAGTKALITAQAKTNKYVEKTANETYKLVDNVDDATKSMDEYKEAAQLVEDLNSWGEQIKDAEAMKGVVDTLTGSYDYLIDYANEFGAIDFTIDNNFDTTSQQFQDMCTKMGESLTTVEDENNEAYKRILTGIEAQGFELANGLNTSAEQLQAAMSQDAALASAVINASMNESGNTITSVSQAAGNVLSALGDLISNFEYDLGFTPYVKSWGKVQIGKWLNNEVDRPFELPTLGMKITGSAGEGGSISNFVSALNEAGNFLSSQDDGFGQGGIFDYGQEPLDFSPLNPDDIETDNIRNDGKGGKDKYTPEVERYHDITRAIENQERALDDLSNAKDEAFGASKISLMEQELAQMEALKAKQQQLLDEAEKYLALDKAALLSAYPGAKIDANTGEILNFEDLQRNTTSEEQNKILEQYESTIDKINEAKDALEESKRQIKALNYEKLSYAIEIKLEINDAALKEIDTKIKILEKDFYSMAESASLLYSKKETDKIDLLGSKYEDLKDSQQDLTAAYNAGKITQADYIEGLKSNRDEVQGLIDDLLEIDDTMLHFYGETLSAGAEQLALYTDEMDHLNDVLQHYIDISELLGIDDNYEMMGEFLRGQREMAKNSLDISKANYEDLQARKAEVWATFSKMKPGDENYEWWAEQWKAISEAANEAQDQMLEDTKAWIESEKAIIENGFKEMGKDLEKLLVGGGKTFDTVRAELDALEAQQEDYLTKTNALYETNKLMRTAQQAQDKTTNATSKARLQSFIDETKALQNNTKLSKLELDIQQAKYDLLLAEIAVEDAQNAKSQVRLTRDNEGNFGYVYTADQEAVAKAEQDLADAQNNLYNIALDGANEYARKTLEAREQYAAELAEIQELALTDSEEANRRMAILQDKYFGPNGILTNYSHLYGIAVTADSDAMADAHIDNVVDMSIETTKIYDNFLTVQQPAINKAIEDWGELEQSVNETVGGALDNTTDSVDELVSAHGDLKDIVEDEVLDALSDEYDAVEEITGAYERQRTSILSAIAAYQQYISAINKTIASAASDVPSSETETDEEIDDIEGSTATGDDVTPSLSVGGPVIVKTTATHFTRDGGNGTKMKSFVPGGTYSVMQIQGNEVLIGRGGVATGWVKKTDLDLVGFDTGGYTGEWGPDGKLGILHEKELILEPGDTENILASVSILRDLIHSIDVQAVYNSLGKGLLSPQLSLQSGQETLEQNVHIEATFPNVQNHNEIEEAFNNLINTASQYANRKF